MRAKILTCCVVFLLFCSCATYKNFQDMKAHKEQLRDCKIEFIILRSNIVSSSLPYERIAQYYEPVITGLNTELNIVLSGAALIKAQSSGYGVWKSDVDEICSAIHDLENSFKKDNDNVTQITH